MERVSISRGDSPILIVAPHGANDINTALLAERIARFTNGYYVINRGWRRGSKYDYWREIANCNDIRHCHEDVVREEFLDPILNFASEIKADYGICQMFVIHGVSNAVRKEADDRTLDMIIGFGDGQPPSFSCDPELKNYFLAMLEKVGITAFQGAKGGRYAGRGKNNLNQLFRRWYKDEDVDSMQIEVVHELRADLDVATFTADAIGSAIENLLDFDDATHYTLSSPKQI